IPERDWNEPESARACDRRAGKSHPRHCQWDARHHWGYRSSPTQILRPVGRLLPAAAKRLRHDGGKAPHCGRGRQDQAVQPEKVGLSDESDPFDLMVNRASYSSWLAFLNTVRTERFIEVLALRTLLPTIAKAA